MSTPTASLPTTLYMWSHTAAYVCPNAAMSAGRVRARAKRGRCDVCVLILLRGSAAAYVSSHYYICCICVRTLLYLQAERGQGCEVRDHIGVLLLLHLILYYCIAATYVSSYYYSLHCCICRQSEGEGGGDESDAPLPRKHSAALKNSIVPVKAAPSAFYISDFTRELWAAAGAFNAFAP